MSTIGANIRAARQAAGMTLEDLEEATGIAKPNLSRIENDHVTPRIPTISRIANGLGVTSAHILAEGAGSLVGSRLHLAAAANVELQAADSAGGRLPRFSMLAYTGGPMQLEGWYDPVVIDLVGLKAASASVPILRSHQMDRLIGHSEAIEVRGSTLVITGVVSGSGPDAEEVRVTASNGFPWQASVGATPSKVEYVAEGLTQIVNGQQISGPCNIIRACTLYEVSFVPVGADTNTSATVTAKADVLATLPMIKHGRVTTSLKVAALSAAACLSGGLPEAQVLAAFGEQAVEMGEQWRGHGCRGLMLECADTDGVNLPVRMDYDHLRAGFSTNTFSTVISTVANQAMLAAYSEVETVAALIAGEDETPDFRPFTRYRLTEQSNFELAGSDGELRSSALSGDAYTNQIDGTRGVVFTLGRHDVINDSSLGAFLQIPRLIGRNAAVAREVAVFKLLLANAGNFFHADNMNLLTGGSSALSITSLGLAEKMLREQVDSGGNPVLLKPAFLLVPPGLKAAADQLYSDRHAAAGSDGTCKPVTSPLLTSARLAGASDTAWYVLSNPRDVAAVVVAYLQGKRVPTIETARPPAGLLGIALRGYFEFGVGFQDKRAAVKSAGQ
jgi:transcriptional regulator with XRE-family HTH domain